MPDQSQTAFLEALGWTLLNSWWQFGILWVLFLLIKRVLPKLSAANRYNLALSLLLAGVSWTIISLFLRCSSLHNENYQVASIADNNLHSFYTQVKLFSNQLIPYVSVFYLVWLAVRLIRFSRLFKITTEVKRNGLSKVPVNWRIFLEKMSAHMNIGRDVQLWLSDRIDTPLILGWLKPVILLPFSAVNQLTNEQLEAILIHELAHIKRNDYFWNMLVSLAEVIYYFNPFVHCLVAAIREEREHSCDDWVLQFPFIPTQYANALLQLEQQRSLRQSALMLAASGNSRQLLLIRVRRMLKMPVVQREPLGRNALMAGILAFCCLFAMVEPREEIRHIFMAVVNKPAFSYENSVAFLTKKAAPVAETQGSSAPSASSLENKSIGYQPAERSSGNSLNKLNELDTHTEEQPDPPTAEWASADYSVSYEAEPSLALTQEARAYALPEEKNTTPGDVQRYEYMPYVPLSSFKSAEPVAIKDTNYPVAMAEKHAQISLQAKEAALTSQLALERLNWTKLRRQLAAKGLNEEVIQLELEKLMVELDWNSIQADARKMMADQQKKEQAASKKRASQAAKKAIKARVVYF